MGAERINFSPFIGTTVILLFLFSTVYTLVFFFSTDATTQLNIKELDEGANPLNFKVSSSGIFGFVIKALDGLLEILSFFSPLTLIKPLFVAITIQTPFLYNLINLLIWRPASVAVSLVTLNFIISKIPTVSGESG